MKIRMLHQAWPTGGGAVLPAGALLDLDDEIVATLPKDAYVVLKVAKTPADKQARTPRDK